MKDRDISRNSYSVIETPAGPLHVSATDSCIIFCHFSMPDPYLVRSGIPESKAAAELEGFILSYFKKNPIELTLNMTAPTETEQVKIFFFKDSAGEAENFTLTIDMGYCSEKEFAVYRALSSIPCGDVISYGELAMLAGIPRGGRFVGNTMAKNRFPVIIPCHRVIKSDGTPGTYTSGPERKIFLLNHESTEKIWRT